MCLLCNLYFQLRSSFFRSPVGNLKWKAPSLSPSFLSHFPPSVAINIHTTRSRYMNPHDDIGKFHPQLLTHARCARAVHTQTLSSPPFSSDLRREWRRILLRNFIWLISCGTMRSRLCYGAMGSRKIHFRLRNLHNYNLAQVSATKTCLQL